MSLIEREDMEGVTRLVLKNGVTNPISLEFVQELHGLVVEARDDPSVRSLVMVSGNDKFFSIGFDLPTLSKQGKEDVMLFYQSFNRLTIDLFTMPKPTVAALKGHAIAGGCILALCFDYRYMAEGRKLMGLNEVKLGLPVPYPADNILRHLVGDSHARDIMEGGEFFEAEDSLKMGLVDEVLPMEKVLERSMEKAKQLGGMPEIAFSMIKQNRVEPVKGRILARLEQRELYFLECFFSEGTQALIKEAVMKF
jgi:enoyl-CoA hydratase/carnithine racemase